MSYITLGQPSTELSGGEAQRIKLATELAKRATGKTIYVLDEPTTGLHFYDVHKLVDVLQKLTDRIGCPLFRTFSFPSIKPTRYQIS